MTKSNNQRDADDYQQEMSEMKARMAKMQAQLDKMSAESDKKKPKTHLAALPKKSAQESKATGPEAVLARANAKQASVISESNHQQHSQTTQPSSTTKTSSRQAKGAKKRRSRWSATTPGSSSQAKQARSTATARSTAKRVDHSSASETSKKVTAHSAATHRASATAPSSAANHHSTATQSHRRVAAHSSASPRVVFPGSGSAASGTPKRAAHRSVAHASATSSAATPQSSQSPQSPQTSQAASAGTTKTVTNSDQQAKMSAMNQDLNDLLAKVGMDSNDAKDLDQTYFYFISLIDNGKLVDQGRIITFNTKKMNHNGVVRGSDGEYYLDLGYLSKPHPRADALPLPKGYLVNLEVAKTIPDVETKNPAATDQIDANINLGGNTTVDMPESDKNSGYYIPLSKLNGGKIPVHRVSEGQVSENGSPHEAFVDHEPSQTMQLRTPRRPTSGETDIHFDRPSSAAKRPATSAAPATAQRSSHEESREELRRERDQKHQGKQHVGLGRALGTMFGFGSRR